MEQNNLHISLHYGVERRLQEPLTSAYGPRLIWSFQSINRLILDLIIFIIFDLIIDVRPYYMLLCLRKSAHQIPGLESRQMTIYSFKVSFTESCNKTNNFLGLIKYELNSLLGAIYSIRPWKIFAKYFNWIDLPEGWITAESNPQVYKVQVWQKTQVSQGKVFSALCYHNNSPDKEIIKIYWRPHVDLEIAHHFFSKGRTRAEMLCHL